VPAVWVGTTAALALVHLALGWYLGFHSIVSYLAFWLLATLTSLTAWRLTLSLFSWDGRVDAFVRAGIIGFALIVVTGMTLGAAGHARLGPWLAASVAVFLVSRFLAPPERAAPSTESIPVQVVAIGVPLLACIAAVGLTHSPYTLYDSLSYHLYFPARWLQAGRLAIVPTPFSDPAQAYQPLNGELFFLWLMIPFHGDLLARIGQLPFLLMAAASLYLIARRSGAAPGHAGWAPLFLCLLRPVVEQAVGADVDLVCTAMFLASLYLGLVAADRGRSVDWLLWGVSLGLYLGSKYLALIYLPVLLIPAVRPGGRARAFWGVQGLMLFAGPWYLRNWLIAGSPIYPASLSLAGVTLAHGAYSREALKHSVFHLAGIRLWPVVAARAFGAPAFVFWIPCALLSVVACVKRRSWWPAGLVLLLPVLMAPLEWLGVPDNADARFLLPAVAVAMGAFALQFTASRRANAWLHGAFAAGVAWQLAGAPSEIHVPVPWFMDHWLSLECIVARQALPWFAAAAAVSAVGALMLSRRPRRDQTAAIALAAGLGCVILVFAQPLCAPARCEALDLSSIYLRAAVMEGWTWERAHIAHSVVAYTGNNLPYPLAGDDLSNLVVYINIDRHVDWQFHDYARVRRHQGAAAATTLARASGQLAPPADGEGGASRPRFERTEGNRDAWVQNLKAGGARHLFVSALTPYEIDYVWHNADGFPIEDEWARADPASFALLYENYQVRVYGLSLR